jgi:hypothetical protein
MHTRKQLQEFKKQRELERMNLTHRFEDSINYNSREYYGTNANGTKFKK